MWSWGRTKHKNFGLDGHIGDFTPVHPGRATVGWDWGGLLGKLLVSRQGRGAQSDPSSLQVALHPAGPYTELNIPQGWLEVWGGHRGCSGFR